MAWDLPEGVDWSGLVGCMGSYALVMARVLGLCLTAPGLAVPGLDWRFRLGLAVMLGRGAGPGGGRAQAVSPPDWAGRRLGGSRGGLDRRPARLDRRADRGRGSIGRRAGRRPGGALDRDALRPRVRARS